MTVLEIMQVKLVGSNVATFEMEVAVGEVGQVIKNYCNVEIVPEELYYTWANMAIDLVSYANQVNACTKVSPGSGTGQDSIDSADVSALKIGDTQVTLEGGSSSTNVRAKALSSHKPLLDDIVMNYRGQLNQFRKLVW